MNNKRAFAFFVFVFCLAFQQTVFSQVECTGKSLFTEKKCIGDEISNDEKELIKIVNDYRRQNGLALVSSSDSLSALANRHLLDLVLNVKTLTHGWSNCPYDFQNQKTWSCVSESPRRLNIGYTGEGFENLYRNKTGAATPSLALEAWKKSDLHKSLILNQNVWRDRKWDAFGVAIKGEYVALWFGSSTGETELKGLAATYENAVND
jgi:hypothetical protein